MKLKFISTLVLALSVNVCFGGVDYYSGTSTPYVVSGSTVNSAGAWKPLDATVGTSLAGIADSVGLSPSYSAPTLSVQNLSTNTSIAVTVDFGDLQVFQSGVFDPATAFMATPTSSQKVFVMSDQTPASGFDSNFDNYFGWVAKDSSQSTLAFGWARVTYDPTTPTVSDTSKFKILDWAYTTDTSQGNTIGFGEMPKGGDNNDGGSNGAVPEPGSLAIFGLIGLGAIASRRRR